MLIAFAKDWNDVPTCVTHVLRGMARARPVLWVESIGTRTPSLGSSRDLRRILRRLRAAAAGPQWMENRLWVWSPLLIPRADRRLTRAVNRALFAWGVRRWKRHFRPSFTPRALFSRASASEKPGLPSASTCNLQPKFPFSAFRFSRSPLPEYWCFVPNAVDLLPPGAYVVYYCVDDWTRFENLDGAWMGAKERRLLACADTVFATSAALVEKCRAVAGDRVHYMPHGVDVTKFRRALDPATPVPPDLATVPHPVVGFYGTVAPWLDFNLLTALARARPDWTFIMLGPVYVHLAQILNLQPSTPNLQPATFNLQPLPNLHFPGRREHDLLPACCKAFDAAIIPYDVEHPRMVSVNPVKVRELLAAGVPIVACDLPELHGFGDDVIVAGRDPQSWLDALERQVRRRDRAAISHRRDGDDWSRRIATMRDIIAAVPSSP